MEQYAKKVLRGIFSIGGILTAVTLTGCCGYQGYANYDSCTELNRENERVTGEKENLQMQNGKIKIEKLITYTYDQNLQIDSKKGVIYTECTKSQVIGNCILYPFTLISAPAKLLVMDDEVQKKFGHEYMYSSDRQLWNMFNPFICTMGEVKLKEKILSTKKIKETRSRTQCVLIREGQLQFVSGNKKRTLPVSVSGQEIYQLTFDHPLPEKTENISIIFNGKTYPFTICSTDLLALKEKNAWSDILNTKTVSQVMDGNALESLEMLRKNGRIDDSAYQAEKTRLLSLLDTARFPKKSICSSSVPIYGEFVSGTSYQWFLRFMPDSNKWTAPKSLDPATAIYGFHVNNGNQILIFATEKPFSAEATGTAVLVMRDFFLDSNFEPDTVIAKILRENPGAKHDLKTKVIRKENDIKQVAVLCSVVTDYTSTIRTKDKEWRLKYTKAEYEFKITPWGKQQLSETEISYMRSQIVPRNGVQGSVLIQILDINLYKIFSDMKTRDQQLKKAAEERAAQEKKAADLNALSL